MKTRFAFTAATAVVAALALGLAPPAAAQNKSLTLGTASTGGTYFIYGGVIATLLTNKLGVTVSTQQTQGPNQNIVLVSEKKVELGMTTMGIAFHAWEGTPDNWTKGKKYQDIRALFPMYDTPFHFIALAKSVIMTVVDLKG